MALRASDCDSKKAYGGEPAVGSTGPAGWALFGGLAENGRTGQQQPHLDYSGDKICAQDHGTES